MYRTSLIGSDRHRRGVPFRDADALAPLPNPNLAQMQTDAHAAGRNLTLVIRSLGQHLRSFNFVAGYQAAPQALRDEATQASLTLRIALGHLVSAQREWRTWRHDLNYQLQVIAGDPVRPGELQEVPEREFLLEYQMELTDIIANLAYVRNQDASVANADFLARLAPYLHPARRPPEENQAATTPAAPSSGVEGAPAGYPQGMSSYTAGYHASWETQARFFQWGQAIDGDAHHRRFRFQDSSFVDIQAHVPILTTTYLSDGLVLGAAVLLAAAAPVSLGASVAVGAAVTAGGSAARPYDAAWQGYTARYFPSPQANDPAEVGAWGTRSYYGTALAQSPLNRVVIEDEVEPAAFFNFADRPTDFVWHRWFWPTLNPRRPALDNREEEFAFCGVEAVAASAIQQAQCLISHLAAREQVVPGASLFELNALQSTPQTWLAAAR